MKSKRRWPLNCPHCLLTLPVPRPSTTQRLPLPPPKSVHYRATKNCGFATWSVTTTVLLRSSSSTPPTPVRTTLPPPNGGSGRNIPPRLVAEQTYLSVDLSVLPSILYPPPLPPPPPLSPRLFHISDQLDTIFGIRDRQHSSSSWIQIIPKGMVKIH